MKKSYLLFVLFSLVMGRYYGKPSAGVPLPPFRNASDVKSLFSDAYTNVAGTDWFPNWGQTTVVTEESIAGNPTKKYANFNYQGVQFASPVDASGFTNLHIDFWTPNCTSFEVYLINTSPTTVEKKVVLTPTLSGWNSFDIPLSQFTTIALNNIGQFKFVSASGTSTAYLDNIYFWKSASTPTITGFSIPAKLLGDAPFAITPPTSNSPGAFSYSSGNTAVATISGDIITIVGAGTSIITATQAASGSFVSGTATSTLVVTYPPPPAAAAVPSKLPADVLSLYSDSYTNVAGINWNPGWGQSTAVSEITYSGNATRKYEFMNYQGVEFTGTVNASSMNYLHLDVWTPNCTGFEVSLINLGPTIEKAVMLTPTLSGWNSFDIPLVQFTPQVSLSNIGQMKFVATPFGGSTVYVDNIFFWKNAPLPVAILDFKGAKTANGSLLTWKTASESNNRGFAIERSENGRNWTELFFVNGSGNSNVEKRYSITDNKPLKGNNVYRLKQVDNDGKATYSPTVSVRYSDDNIGFTFFPNPAKNKLNVQVEGIVNNVASLTLLNADGKAVKSIAINRQQISSNIVVDLSGVARGIYMLVLQDGNTTKTSKVVID